MDEATQTRIKEMIAAGDSTESIKTSLVESGFLEEDAALALELAEESVESRQDHEHVRHLFSRISLKDVSDRIGFGFSSHQYLNILFLISGASLWLIGLINGLRTLLSVFYSSLLEEYLGRFRRYKPVLTVAGTAFALSFLILILGLLFRSPVLFAVGITLNGLISVGYGIPYQFILTKMVKEEKHIYLKRMNTGGIVLTALSIILAGYLLQTYQDGWAIVLLICTFAFLGASISTFTLKEPLHKEKHHLTFFQVLMGHYSKTSMRLKEFFKNPVLLTLLVTGAVTSLVQTLGGAYYGIYIFQHLNKTGFGGYLNVALIFVFALLGTYLGSFVTQHNAKSYGKFPMLVFGTLLVAIMPLTYYYNTNIVAIGMATMLGMIGANIVGIARSLLTVELLSPEKREKFFEVSSVLVTIPYIVFIPLGAYVAQVFGLRALFLILALALVIVVMPLYLTVVIAYNKVRKV